MATRFKIGLYPTRVYCDTTDVAVDCLKDHRVFLRATTTVVLYSDAHNRVLPSTLALHSSELRHRGAYTKVDLREVPAHDYCLVETAPGYWVAARSVGSAESSRLISSSLAMAAE